MKIFNHFLTESQVPRLIDIEDITWRDGAYGVQQALSSMNVIFKYLKGKKVETPIIEKLDAMPSLIMGQFTYQPILFEANGSPVNPQEENYLMIDEDGYLMFDENSGSIIRSGITSKIPFKTVKIKTEHYCVQDSFFIATRSLFSKTPKILFTKQDVNKYYADEPDLKIKLLYALRYGAKLKIPGIVQGDLIFTEKDLTHTPINDEDNVIFRSNTIIYGIPQSSDEYEVVNRAKIGLYFYASYSGEFKWVANRNKQSGKIESIYPSADWLSHISKVDTSYFAKTKDVFYDDAILKDSIKKHDRKKISPRHEMEIEQNFNDVKSLLKETDADINKILHDKLLKKMIILFTAYLKNKSTGTNILDELTIKGIIRFINDYYDKKFSRLKLKHAIVRATKEKEYLTNKINDDKKMISRVFQLQFELEKLKLRLLKQLNSLKLDTKSFVQTKNDFFYQVVPSQYMVDVGGQTIMRLSDRSHHTDNYVSELDDEVKNESDTQ